MLTSTLLFSEQVLEKRSVEHVLRTIGVFGPNQGCSTRNVNDRIAETMLVGICDNVCVRQSAGAPHEIHDSFVDNSNQVESKA
jgi:hypothetical protein